MRDSLRGHPGVHAQNGMFSVPGMHAAACGKCGSVVVPETDMELRKEYPYYCPCCDENMYSFECIDIRAAVLQETPAAEYSRLLEK